ncbi:MAG: hypothetical protein JW986_03070 [Methanotrichaceae archaeon]|nr:hypothetical protein [Methanotrichaceae archaeon]
MRTIWYIVLAVFIVGTGSCQLPNLVGNWTSAPHVYFSAEGLVEPTGDYGINMTIVDQSDRHFMGYISYWLPNGTEVTEGLAGAIGFDNTTIYIAEFDRGYDLGRMLSNDEMELVYIEDGKDGMAEVDMLIRIRD